MNTLSDAFERSDAEKRDLLRLITEGKPFPERYFENEWQSFRTRQNRALDLTTAPHVYEKPGRYTVAVKVIDIFGNDTMTLMPITAG